MSSGRAQRGCQLPSFSQSPWDFRTRAQGSLELRSLKLVSYSVKSTKVVRGIFRHTALTHCSLPTPKHERNLLY